MSVGLRNAADPWSDLDMWTHPPGSSFPGSPTTLALDVVDEVLRLDLENQAGSRRMSFWIDLKEGKLLKRSYIKDPG